MSKHMTRHEKLTLADLKNDRFLLWAAEDLMSRGMSEHQAVETVLNTYVRSKR